MINQLAIECYMLTQSHEPIIQMLEAAGIETEDGARIALTGAVKSNVVSALSYGSSSAGISTSRTAGRVLEHFRKKEEKKA